MMPMSETSDLMDLAPRSGFGEEDAPQSFLEDPRIALLSAFADTMLVARHETGEIIDVSPALARLLRIPRQDLCGMKLSALFLPEIAGLMSDAAGDLDRAGLHRESQVPCRRGDGSTLFAEVTGVRFASKSGERMAVVFRDVTDRVTREGELLRLVVDLRAADAALRDKTEALTRANLDLLHASKAKDEFLAAVSHELRTPLNAILGLSEALDDDVYGDLSEPQRRALRRISESGQQLLALISEILDLSQLSAGEVTLSREPIALDDLCRSSLQHIQDAARRKQISARLRVDVGYQPLHADRRRVTQILVSLLRNAVKFTPEGGAMGLSCSLESRQQAVRFTVWDTGIGIADEDHPKLFQPFVQLDAGLARQHPGTGLGLAIVRELTALHGGGIELESEPGHGSRFSVILPTGPAAGDVAANDVGPTESMRPTRLLPGVGHTVLIAADDPPTVATLHDQLAARGFEVVNARDGREATRLCWERAPDLVIVDTALPVLDGLGVMRELRSAAVRELRDVPIVAYTALAMPGDRERCLTEGADAFLVKPILPGRLADVMDGLLARVEC